MLSILNYMQSQYEINGYEISEELIKLKLFLKNIVVMTLGLIGFGSVLGYIAYMRSKYESQGYYAAVQEDGTEVYAKRRSKWE